MVQGLYLLLITNKGSNILEDLDTLRLLSKVVPEYVHPVDEEGVSTGAFELIFAFDEVISMGHRESISVAQVSFSATCQNAHYPQIQLGDPRIFSHSTVGFQICFRLKTMLSSYLVTTKNHQT